MKIRAYAKVNLALNVKGRLPDDYHDLEMCMVPVSIYDEIEIEIADKMEFICNRKYLMHNPTNSLLKAIELLRAKYHFTENFRIVLNKHVPTKAGLGGGSSDGASIIKAVNKLLKLEMTDEDIKDFCLKLGADVYFAYYNRPAFVSGIGDRISFIDNNLKIRMVLVRPRHGVSTKKSYKNLDLSICEHPDVFKVIEALGTGNYQMLVENLGNSLEQPSFKLLSELALIKNDLIESGADGVLMSGSGSTIFAISNHYEILKKIEVKYRNLGYFATICEVLNEV